MNFLNGFLKVFNICADNGTSYEMTEKALRIYKEGEVESLKILADLYTDCTNNDHADYLFSVIKEKTKVHCKVSNN